MVLCYIDAIREEVPELERKENAGASVSGENDAEERLVMSDDLLNSEAEAVGMHMSSDSVIRAHICAPRLCVFNNATDGSSQRIPRPEHLSI